MPQKPAKQGLNIVVLGQFNPAIFHPVWFAAQDLIRSQEAENAEIQLIHPDAAIFQIDWARIHIVRERFQAGTPQEPYFEPLRDLVSGVFSLLGHTPTRALGINWEFHYRLTSEKIWHQVGHQLAPKDVWKDLLNAPGTRSLVIEGERSDGRSGYIRAKVEPSSKIEYGVNIEVNDHYDLEGDSKSASRTDRLIEILSENWNESMRRAHEIAEKIAGLGDHV